MIALRRNQLVFRFPEVYAAATCSIGFQRTVRIPDDNRAYSFALRAGTVSGASWGRLPGQGAGQLESAWRCLSAHVSG